MREKLTSIVEQDDELNLIHKFALLPIAMSYASECAATQNGQVGGPNNPPPQIVAGLQDQSLFTTKYRGPPADRFCFFAVAAHVFSANS